MTSDLTGPADLARSPTSSALEHISMRRLCLILAVVVALPSLAFADDSIGQIKKAAGTVNIIRAGASRPALAGDRVFQDDVVSTGADGTVGITFNDDSLMSLGPDSELKLDQFQFNPAAHTGAFDTSLHKGTLAVKSGQIVAQQPEAMQIHTPAAILGVRGTEFVVRAVEGGASK
jgi:hypothetical protein